MYEKPRKVFKYLRETRNLTQESLAERTNYSVDSIRRWECGMTPAPIPALMEIAEKLDAPWLVFLYLKEQYGDGFLRGVVPDFTVGMPLAEAAAGFITRELDMVDKRFDRELLRMMADGRIDEVEEPVYEKVNTDAWQLMGDILNLRFHGEESQ